MRFLECDPRVCLLVAAILGAGAHAQQYSSGPLNLPIPDGGALSSEIAVSNGPLSIGSVRIQLRIAHTWDADLDAVLLPPGGVEYLHLFSDVGGSGDNFETLTLDGSAARSVRAAGAPFSGAFQPEGGDILWQGEPSLPPVALAGLNSLNARSADGVWTLVVCDDSPGESGALLEWGLVFAGPGVPTNPAGVLSLTPPQCVPGGPIVATLIVSAGQAPASSGVVALVDASELGAGVLEMRDDGVAPDSAPGDLVYSCAFAVAPATSFGTHRVSFSVTDAQGRSAQGGATAEVVPAPAPNDLCSGALNVPPESLPFVGGPVVLGGNAEAAEAQMSCAAGGEWNAVRSVWYRFACARSGEYVLSTRTPGTDVADTVLALYASADGGCSSLSLAACDDDGAGEYKSKLINILEAGRVYYLQVAAWAPADPPRAGAAALTVELRETGACCTGSLCEVRTREACESAGGVYLGDGVACELGGGRRITTDGGTFEDIGASGAPLSLGDDAAAPAPLGFLFPFMGGLYGEAFIGSNGMLGFGAGSTAFANGAVPGAQLPNNSAYVLWDDLDPSVGGDVRFQTRGVPGVDQRFIAQWTAVPQYGAQDANTFQAVLFENGDIEYRYGAISRFSDADATVGVENADGTVGASVRASTLAPGVSLRIREVAGTPACAGCGWRTDGCFADYNNDDGIDGDDVIVFFGDWDNGVMCADVDGSLGVDGDDVIAFLGVWDIGGC